MKQDTGIFVRISQETHDKLKSEAVKLDRSLSWYVRHILERYGIVKEKEKK